MDRLYWLGKWFFLAGGFVGAAEKAAAEAAAGAGAYGGTGDSVNADVDTEGFVSFSTKQRTYICNVLFWASSSLYFRDCIASIIESLLSGSGDVVAKTKILAAFSSQASTLFFFAMMT